MTAELGDRIEVGLLRRWREIADHHVLGHSPTQRAGCSHRELLSDEGWVGQPSILSDSRHRRPSQGLLTAQRFRAMLECPAGIRRNTHLLPWVRSSYRPNARAD